MTDTFTFPDGDYIPMEQYNYIKECVRKELALELERQATYAMISNEYNFNDTAVRAKTYHHAAEIVRGKPSD